MIYKNRKKGFSLIELTLVLSIAMMAAFIKFQDLRNEQNDILSSVVGKQIKQIGEAVNGYINIRYNKLSTLTSIDNGTGDDPGPRTCSTSTNTCTITYQTLINEGLLPSTFTGINANRSSYKIILKRDGVAPNYIINGLVITDNPWIEGGDIRYDLLGKAMQAAGIDSGMSKTTSTISGYSGSWSEQSSDFSDINKKGLLGYRVGYDSSMYTIYLRRDGTLPMTGDLDMGTNNINNAQNITASGTLTSNDLVVKNNSDISGDERVGGTLNINKYKSDSYASAFSGIELSDGSINMKNQNQNIFQMKATGTKNHMIFGQTESLLSSDGSISSNNSSYQGLNLLSMTDNGSSWGSNIISINRGLNYSSNYQQDYSNLLIMGGGISGNPNSDVYNSIIYLVDHGDNSNAIRMNGNGLASNYIDMYGDSKYGNTINLRGNADFSDNYNSYGSGDYSNNIFLGGSMRTNQYDSRTPYYAENANNVGNYSNNITLYGGKGTGSGNITMNSTGDNSGNLVLNSTGQNSGMIQASGNITSSATVSGKYLLSNSTVNIGEACDILGSISKKVDGTPVYCINNTWSNMPFSKNSNGGTILPNGLIMMWGSLSLTPNQLKTSVNKYESGLKKITPNFVDEAGITHTFSKILNVSYGVSDSVDSNKNGEGEAAWGGISTDQLSIYVDVTSTVSVPMTAYYQVIGY